jgi:hypothetical protein
VIRLIVPRWLLLLAVKSFDFFPHSLTPIILCTTNNNKNNETLFYNIQFGIDLSSVKNYSGPSCGLELYPTDLCHCRHLHDLWDRLDIVGSLGHCDFHWRIHGLFLLQGCEKKAT